MYYTTSQVEKDFPTFFSPSSMRFFSSRIAAEVYNGKYFVTSERFDATRPRLYTVRSVDKENGISSVSDFQAFTSKAQAVSYIKKLA